MPKKEKKKSRILAWIEIIILIVAVMIAGYAFWNIASIQGKYAAARNEYEDLTRRFVKKAEPNIIPQTTSEVTPTPSQGPEKNIQDKTKKQKKESEVEEHLPVPPDVSIDWNGLKAINNGIVGWICIDALPQINYPICQGQDNSFYLSHTFTGAINGSGSIFLDSGNASDFTDALTSIYGHRMDDGSMFGSLFSMEDASLIKKTSPYFWIFTPDKILCYQIFSIFEEPADSEMFAYYYNNDKAFKTWVNEVKSWSYIPFNVTIEKKDKVVMLATCTRDRVRRVVVLGKQIKHA